MTTTEHHGDTQQVHPYVAIREIWAITKPGDYDARSAHVTITPAGQNKDVVAVTTYVSADDGATVLKVDTTAAGERIRINVNDGLVYETEDSGNDYDQARAIKHLVDTQFDGDFTQALLSLSRQGDIAVAWMDRDVFAREFAEHDVTLADALWKQMVTKLDDFDGYTGDTDVHADFAKCFLRELVTTNDRGEELHL